MIFILIHIGIPPCAIRFYIALGVVDEFQRTVFVTIISSIVRGGYIGIISNHFLLFYTVGGVKIGNFLVGIGADCAMLNPRYRITFICLYIYKNYIVNYYQSSDTIHISNLVYFSLNSFGKAKSLENKPYSIPS